MPAPVRLRQPVSEPTGNIKEKRRFARRPVLWSGSIEWAGGLHTGRVFNVSAGGAMFQLDVTLPENMPVVAHLRDDLHFDGFIRWARAGRNGVAFVDPPAAIRRAFGSLGKVVGLHRKK
jgi:PilZ domain